MKERKYRKRVVWLSLLWTGSIIPISLYSAIRSVSIQLSVVAPYQNDCYVFLLLALLAFYFFPLLKVIQKYAVLANMDKVIRITKPIIFMMTGVLLVAPIAVLIAILVG